MAATAVGGYIGSVASAIAVGAAAGVVGGFPAFSAATLLTSTAAGLVVAGFSLFVAAPLNFKAAYKRFKAAKNGHELTEEQIKNLETDFDRESPLAAIDSENANKRQLAVQLIKELPSDQKQKAYVSLRADFAKFALKDNKAAAAPKQAATAKNDTAPKA